ncbi:MAG: hypothetical protein KC431_02940 [Myxococcales bacterium]|nr:hypothetical protein [Myxococcales bacterium]
MRRTWPAFRFFPASVLLLALSACPEPAGPDDGGDDVGSETGSTSSGSDGPGTDSDSSTESDSGTDTSTGTDSSTDSGTDSSTDSGTDSSTDTGTDTGGDTGFADIIDCGMIVGELEQPTPSLFTTHLDFRGDPYDDPDDLPLLTEGAQTIMTTPNAGGSSTISEAFAYEVLARCEDAILLKTETEIGYDPVDSKKTDFLIELAGSKVGVSVTRAVGFPPEDPYPAAQASGLVTGKLSDILVSSANVVPEDAWVKQILVIMAYADMHAELVAAAWADVDPMIQADTIVYVVVTDGMDTPIYFE